MFRLLVAAPVLLVLVLFALSNRQSVAFTLWPTDFALELPLSIAVLAAMALAFFLGALVLWMSALAARRRARRAEHAVRLLEAQVAELKARVTPAPAGSLVSTR
jgi:uncharacterized integral membrane protein